MPLLPQFRGMENENLYTHIKDFEKVCHTFQEGTTSIDLKRLKVFPFTLKDKGKVWLNSLRPRSIHSWPELQVECLKKFFPIHCTSGLKRKISNFMAIENEKKLCLLGEIYGGSQCLFLSWFWHLDVVASYETIARNHVWRWLHEQKSWWSFIISKLCGKNI